MPTSPLTSARSFTVAGERLTRGDADGAALAAFVQSQELAGTEWQVTAYHNGSSAVVGCGHHRDHRVRLGQCDLGDGKLQPAHR